MVVSMTEKPQEAKQIAVKVLRSHGLRELAETAERDPDEIWIPCPTPDGLILISGRAEYPDIIMKGRATSRCEEILGMRCEDGREGLGGTRSGRGHSR